MDLGILDQIEVVWLRFGFWFIQIGYLDTFYGENVFVFSAVLFVF